VGLSRVQDRVQALPGMAACVVRGRSRWGCRVVLDALVDQLGGWLRDVRTERLTAKDKAAAAKDQKAGDILYHASVLVASMQAYDNHARRAYGDAYRYASQPFDRDEAPAITEARRKAYRRLEKFEDLQELFRRAQRSLHELRGPVGSAREPMCTPGEEEALVRLIDRGQQFVYITRDVRSVKEQQRRDFGNINIGAYMRAMARGLPSDEVTVYIKKMMFRIEPLPHLLDEVDLAYSALCREVREHHQLPPLPALNL
jgi:hypothetical protein